MPTLKYWDGTGYVPIAGGMSLATADARYLQSAEADARYEQSGSVAEHAAATDPHPGLVPVGALMQFAGTTTPSGWLLCDGASLDTTQYAALFAVVGYSYGGSGASFSLPNLKGRVAVGLDAAQTEFTPIGKGSATAAGEKTHLLVGLEIPSSHGPDEGSLIDGGQFETGTGNAPVVSSTGSRHKYVARTATPHNNLQPYVVVNHIIKF